MPKIKDNGKGHTEKGELVICRYITKNGKRIFPKNGKCFKFYAKPKEGKK